MKESLWDIHHHLYVDQRVADLIYQQIDKLLYLLQSVDEGYQCLYGEKIVFCDESDTMNDVRRCLENVQRRRGIDHSETFAKDFQRSVQLREAVLRSKNPRFQQGFHSASPIMATRGLVNDVLLSAANCFWKHGTVRPRARNEAIPNPLFEFFLSNGGILDPSTNPDLGYHLTTSMAPLVQGSPLKPFDASNELKA